jgi:hypothetical protein
VDNPCRDEWEDYQHCVREYVAHALAERRDNGGKASAKDVGTAGAANTDTVGGGDGNGSTTSQ